VVNLVRLSVAANGQSFCLEERCFCACVPTAISDIETEGVKQVKQVNVNSDGKC